MTLITPMAGMATQHLPASSTAIAIGTVTVLYFGVIRRRLVSGEAGPPKIPNHVADD